MKSKILFLDIDGVVNSNFFYSNRWIEKFKEYVFEPEKIELLNQLEGASVVVSSSWGPNGGKTTEEFNEAGLKLPILGYTKKIHWQYPWACRGNEIEEWIRNTYGGLGTMFAYDKEWESEDYNYVIFDDDADMLLGQLNHFIHVNPETGLTQADIDRAKEILGL